jgi:hypothetical protein
VLARFLLSHLIHRSRAFNSAGMGALLEYTRHFAEQNRAPSLSRFIGPEQ